MRIRIIILGAVVLIGSFVGATLAINALWPPAAPQTQVSLTPVSPLQPLTGNSTILAPTAISLSAIAQALETQAPRKSPARRKIRSRNFSPMRNSSSPSRADH